MIAGIFFIAAFLVVAVCVVAGVILTGRMNRMMMEQEDDR